MVTYEGVGEQSSIERSEQFSKSFFNYVNVVLILKS